MNTVIKYLDKAVDALVAMVCILLLLIGGYSILDDLWVYRSAMDASLLAYRPDLDRPLENLVSEDQAAWLHIYNTQIDYPIMQGEDNFEYLNQDPYGEFALSGSIFLDYRCARDLTDEYSLCYGHHMAHGAMFGALDDFANALYFEAHTKGRVITGDRVYELTLFAVAAADATEPLLFSPAGRTTTQITEYLATNSILYNDPPGGLPILALSTCSGDTSASRLLVFGTMAELAI